MFRLSGTHELHTKWLYDVRPSVLECEEVFYVSIKRCARTAYEVATRRGSASSVEGAMYLVYSSVCLMLAPSPALLQTRFTSYIITTFLIICCMVAQIIA